MSLKVLITKFVQPTNYREDQDKVGTLNKNKTNIVENRTTIENLKLSF